MFCPNCGADLGENTSCPYCGYENVSAAQAQHKKEIASIYEKIAVMLHRPVEQAQKITHALLLGAGALVVVFLIALLGSFIYSKVNPAISYRNQQATLEKLEGFYADRDYPAMNEMLEEMDDSYKSIYNKYSIIGSMYEQVTTAEEDARSCIRDMQRASMFVDFLNYPLDGLFEVLNQCRELEENGFVYDEEAAVQALSDQAHSILTDILLLTEEEIRQGLEIQQTEVPDYSCFFDICLERLQGEES